MAERDTVADDGEPIFTAKREVNQTGNSLYHTIPDDVIRLLDINDSDSVVIDIYDDGYIVRKE